MNTTTAPTRSPSRLTQLIRGRQIAMLSSCLPGGDLDTKPMALLDVDADGCCWFFCESAADDAAAKERYERVNVSFSDEAESTFIAIAGRGELLHDRGLKRALWSAAAAPWFPCGPDSPRLALLKVTPERTEYWDAPDSRIARGAAMSEALAYR